MGIEKPYEVERHSLGPTPLPHAPFDLRGHVEALITPGPDRTIRIAGHALRATPHRGGTVTVEELRALLHHRLLDRRPDADALTWEWLASILHGELRDDPSDGDELRRILVRAVDAL